MKNFDRSLPMMLHRTLDAVMPPFRSILSSFGLTDQQWRVLRTLWERDQQSLTDLSAATLISAPSLVGVIDRLARNGLVARQRSSGDRRKVQVALTPRGQALETQVTPLVDGAYAELEASIAPEHWQALMQAMEQIVEQSTTREETNGYQNG